MTKSEIDMLQALIAEYENVLSTEPQDVETLYDLLNQAYALYGDIIPQIAEQLEEIKAHSRLISRNSKAILALLKRQLVRETDNFEAGIMPITYENLSICPQAQKQYKNAITKYAEKKYERNILDDIRLSLELLLRQLLENNESLESQPAILKIKLKEDGLNEHLRSMVTTTLTCFYKYENDCVKHNERIDSKVVDYVIEQASAIINFLIKFFTE